MKSFERENIVVQLAALPERRRAAYAVACAERLLPFYRWFREAQSWGDETVLERGIELAWRCVRGEQTQDAEITKAIRDCEAVTPDSEDFSSPGASRALDAASAVAQALEVCINPLPETAADAGEIAWECAFGLEQSRLLEADAVRIADKKLLAGIAQGGFVFLEEYLQQRSLDSLRPSPFNEDQVDNFRKTFATISGYCNLPAGDGGGSGNG
jgi:uncharacterized protein YjaG (DUF416 family)